MITEMKSIKLHETLLNEIVKRFRDSTAITELCLIVISRIEDRIKADILAANA